MERSPRVNDSNNALLALVRSTVLIAQNKEKISSKERALDERNPSKNKLNLCSKEFSNASLTADSSMAGIDSSLKSPTLKRWRDDAPDASNSAVVAVVKRRRTYVNHSYTDFSKQAPDLQYSEKTDLEDMTFAERIHHVLSKKELQSCITWKSHGRAFCILIPKAFEKQVCAEYFAMPPRYSTFLRQLNNHGFKQISQGPDRNCYYHERFLRGMPWLCKFMPQPKNARLLMPDPENEPDFYTLSKQFPLPDEAQDKIC
ncbi:DNA binding protein [Fragilaria crotonensis]|nr:DNA binding protein [Fragilaria crotonensis]